MTKDEFISMVARLDMRTLDTDDDQLEDAIVTLNRLIEEARIIEVMPVS